MITQKLTNYKKILPKICTKMVIPTVLIGTAGKKLT